MLFRSPDCKMVSSETGMFGDGKLESFENWFSRQKPSLFPKNFFVFGRQRVSLDLFIRGMNGRTKGI